MKTAILCGVLVVLMSNESLAQAGTCPEGSPWAVGAKAKGAVEATASLVVSPLTSTPASTPTKILACNCTGKESENHVIVRVSTNGSTEVVTRLYSGACAVLLGANIDIANQLDIPVRGSFKVIP